MGLITQSTPNSDSFEHANHNKDACDFLNDSGKYPDWVLTTAFYAALHYVRSIAFPGFKDNIKDTKGKEVEFESFDKYKIKKWSQVDGSSTVKKQSAHELMKRVANKTLPKELFECYCRLRESSDLARYKSYRISSGHANAMHKDMQAISEYCTKLKNENSST